MGKWQGFETMMKGGFGVATNSVDDVEVMAAAVTNCIGDVVVESGVTLAGARSSDGRWLAENDPFRLFPPFPPAAQNENTTLVLVATNAILNKIEASRLARRADDGVSIAVRPVHTTFDGDTTYALATCEVEASFDLVANIAVETVAEAIRNSVRFARTLGNTPGLYKD